MLWRRDVTEIALARNEHFISNTQTESLPSSWANSKYTVRLEILRGTLSSVLWSLQKQGCENNLLAPGKGVTQLQYASSENFALSAS